MSYKCTTTPVGASPSFGRVSFRKESACGPWLDDQADTGSPAVAGEACPTTRRLQTCQNSEMRDKTLLFNGAICSIVTK